MSSNSTIALAYVGLTAVIAVAILAPTNRHTVLRWQERVAENVTRSPVWDLSESCLSKKHSEQAPASSRRDLIQAVTMAVVGVESYSRPRWIQSVKFALANVYYQATKRLPNISLGLGQMKPVTAGNIVVSANLVHAPSDEEIWRRLWMPCDSVALVSLYFDQQLLNVDDERWRSGEPTVRAEVRDIVRRYNGQRSTYNRSGFESSDPYSAVVLRLVEQRMSRGIRQADFRSGDDH